MGFLAHLLHRRWVWLAFSNPHLTEEETENQEHEPEPTGVGTPHASSLSPESGPPAFPGQ